MGYFMVGEPEPNAADLATVRESLLALERAGREVGLATADLSRALQELAAHGRLRTHVRHTTPKD